MKICLLANAASIHTQRWATYFAEHGYDVTILSLSDGEIPGVPVKRVGLEPRVLGRLAYLLSVLQVRRAIKRLKPDIVHAHYAGGYGLVGALAGHHPLIISAWGSDVLVAPREGRIMKRIVKACLDRADLVTSVAMHMSATIRAMGFTGAMVTLPFGADTTVFYPREDEAEDATGPRLIVSTRNFEPIYNVHLLIEALPKILAGAPSAKVIVIGSGSLREQLERRTRELGVEDHVEFTGKLAATEIAQYLSRAAIFVTTSLSDGNNISLNEAMACGAFPVVTDIPANREWIENGRNGFLVSTHDSDELAEQILAGLDAPNLRRAAADLNWKLIQQRGSWKTAMARMENEYFSIMNRVCTHDAFPGV